MISPPPKTSEEENRRACDSTPKVAPTSGQQEQGAPLGWDAEGGKCQPQTQN